MSHVLEFTDVFVGYRTSTGQKSVLRDVHLNIREGEFVSIVGPTGCGKSTLLKLALGSEFPTSGLVTMDGKPIEGICRDRGIVTQRYSLQPNKTVLDSIAFGPELEQESLFEYFFRFLSPHFWKVRRRSRREAMEYLKRIGLNRDDVDKLPHQLSGGMRQRVAIAQAMIMKPRVLLMDEPFGALDPQMREQMQMFLLELWEQHKMTVLFVTHDLEEALYLGTRIIGVTPYWSENDGSRPAGAVIVTDKELPGQIMPTKWKYSKEFNELLQRVRLDVYTPEHCQKRDEFDLTHQDAVRLNGWEHEGEPVDATK